MKTRKIAKPRAKSFLQRIAEGIERMSPPDRKPRYSAHHGKWGRPGRRRTRR